MIGIVLIGHERIASEMLAAVEHVVGSQPLMQAIDVLADRDVDTLRQQLESAVSQCDVGEGVLILADMFGGTPCNVAIACVRPGRVELVSGINLPLAIKAAYLRQSVHNLERLTEQLIEAGRKYMCHATGLMGTVSAGERGDG